MKENLIERISTALGSEKTLEGFVRQLLEMLELVTDMESTYLTHIDADGIKQHIVYARNSQAMQIPEGLSVPWEDTLCKRALDEGRRYTCDVPAVWGDSEAAKALGITTYVSTPVWLGDGAIYGTLCAASSESRELSDRAEQVLQLFAELISQYIRKEQLLEELQEANAALTAVSHTDELTGLPNRRAVFAKLPKLFSLARNDTHHLLMAFIDLDGFKQINDRYGHKTGDEFLQAIGQRLKELVHDDDVLGRLGGDEFIIATLAVSNAQPTAVTAFKNRLSSLLSGRYHLSGTKIDYAGASIGIIHVDPQLSTPDSAVRDADAAMYEDKGRRKQRQVCGQSL
ncbi:sensor domain-containing diguanylate cyclase [Pantoea agglomerans]|uniref:Sensor domain-containing diguanylate cyclase n=1 Tax=Enterobacter agglomerans TaxID=549 RepID=A0ACC5RJ12_ENTAG|nr:sensor domain-containing diguanylate cyclase [Pantoea agglomerans]MBK4724696.1 sensor domain-containing diguanylate cyclase [Pantoea agglomerans]